MDATDNPNLSTTTSTVFRMSGNVNIDYISYKTSLIVKCGFKIICKLNGETISYFVFRVQLYQYRKLKEQDLEQRPHTRTVVSNQKENDTEGLSEHSLDYIKLATCSEG